MFELLYKIDMLSIRFHRRKDVRYVIIGYIFLAQCINEFLTVYQYASMFAPDDPQSPYFCLLVDTLVKFSDIMIQVFGQIRAKLYGSLQNYENCV